VLDEQRVDLDGEFSAQVRYDELEQTIVGFHWEWPD